MKYYTNKKCLPYSVGFEFGFKLVFIKVSGQCFLAHYNGGTTPFNMQTVVEFLTVSAYSLINGYFFIHPCHY